MHEVTIKYKNSKTLKLLKDLSKYFDFVVSTPRETINGVTLIRGDRTIDTSELTNIFSGRNLDSKKLRQQAWTRKK
jgi:hypothetical protein